MEELANLTWPTDIDAAGLPKVRDRLQAASMFFDVKLPAAYVLQGLTARTHRWMSWASLAALASIPEVVELELAELGLAREWRESQEYGYLVRDPLFAILKELRNYETHIDFLEREKLSSGIHMSGYHFAEINFSDLEKLRNIANRKSQVTQESVREFNKLARNNTTEAIVGICANNIARTLLTYVNRIKASEIIGS